MQGVRLKQPSDTNGEVLISRFPDYVGSSPYPFKDGDKRSALWFSEVAPESIVSTVIVMNQWLSRLIHESIGNMGDGHKPNAKTSAYDEGNDSVIATADAPTRTQSIRDVSAIGNKCIRRRLRFIRSYCQQHYTYSC